METKKVTNSIVTWLKEKLNESKLKGFVVGVSGGVDSAVTSTLCCETGYPVFCVSMPIHQKNNQIDRASDHIKWLHNKYSNITTYETDLTQAYESFNSCLPEEALSEIAKVNNRSRLRMTSLYSFAGSLECLVAGTGNKVEDFGIGFFTKYGDGGVDLSPLGSLTKTDVFKVASYLEVIASIQSASPTDGLWEDSRTDEEQIGATYPNLEIAMKFCEDNDIETVKDFKALKDQKEVNSLAIPEEILYNYLYRHEKNKHKMEMPPVCLLKKPLNNL